jgi:Rieske Fe-S protein
MKRTVESTKNPFDNLSRRSALGVLGVGLTGVFVACNDDLSPLSINLASDVTGDITAPGSVMLTATLIAGMADAIEFYEGAKLLETISTRSLTAITKTIPYTDAQNGLHTYSVKAMSTLTSKQAYSNAVDVKVNIAPVVVPVVPTLNLTSSSTALTAPGTITLTATVTGGNVPITAVEFFDGTTSLGMATLNAAGTAYTKDFPFAATPTSRSFKAVGTSSAGAATSNIVTVTLNIPLPTITLISSSTNVTAVGNITLTATVAGGTVTQIEFFEGTTSLGVVPGSPYTKTVSFTATSPAQTHNYIARGTITGGATVESTSVNVNVNIGNVAPTIALASSSLSVTANGNITLTATATAKTGTISTVEFFDGTTSLGIVNAAPFTLPVSFTATKNGMHNYTAKAIDSNGNSATSTPAVAVVVNIPTAAPTITLASSSTSVTANGSVTLTATVTPDTGVTITKVDFYEGTTLLGTKTAAPFTFTPAFTSANNGTHSYTAKATDSSGKSTTSTALVVTVNIATVAPSITLTSSSTNVTAAGSITLTAAVTAGTGTISKVEFFDGTTLVNTKTTAPYTYAPAFTNANNGTHNYTAKVTASDGSTVTSPAITVTVNITATAGTRIALYTQLAAAGSYVNFNHPTSGIKCILYRAPSAQNGGVSNAGAFYVAYSRKCTHAGTIITQNPNTANPHVLTCQDHGATYNMDSNCAPINGVAPTALPTILITVGTDGIYI